MDQAGLLLGIQALDVRIARAERSLAEMPEKRAILEARKRIADIESLEARTDAFITEIERAVARQEDEVAKVAAKIDSEQGKLLSGKITDAREVQNISLELDSLKRRKEQLETEVLAEMEKRERGLEQKAKIDTAMLEAQMKESELVEGFKGKGGELQVEIETATRDREAKLAELLPEYKTLYENHRAERAGVIIGVLTESACGACRMELPAEEAKRLREGPPVATCPLCRRILVVRTEEVEE